MIFCAWVDSPPEPEGNLRATRGGPFIRLSSNETGSTKPALNVPPGSRLWTCSRRVLSFYNTLTFRISLSFFESLKQSHYSGRGKVSFKIYAGGSGVLAWLPPWKIATQSIIILGCKYSAVSRDSVARPACRHGAWRLRSRLEAWESFFLYFRIFNNSPDEIFYI